MKDFFKHLQVKQQSYERFPLLKYRLKLFLAAGRNERGELLIVLTNCNPSNAVAIYLRRWEIECLFQSLKERGFNFEDTHVTASDRIERLIAVTAIAFCWAHKVGEWKALKKPIRFKQFKRQSRPMFTYFRYGLDEIGSYLSGFKRSIQQFRRLIHFLKPPDCLEITVMEAAS